MPVLLLYLSGKGRSFSPELAYFLTSVIIVARRVSFVKVAAVQSCQSVEANTGERVSEGDLEEVLTSLGV